MRKVALAYSGGLDTSVCIPLLREHYGYDYVITVVVDVGQPEDDLKEAKVRAEILSDKHITIDAKSEFVNDYLFQLIKANGNYEGYVIGTSIARPLIARKVVEVADEEGAEALAHGCTGKGNDQLRFELIFRTADMRVIAPMRELNLTRSEECKYAEEHGVKFSTEKVLSIDENIWSRSIEGGELENPGFIPPEEIFKWTTSPDKAPDAEIVEIGFEEGLPTTLNKDKMDGLTLIGRLNELGGRHGVGRTDMIEDRVLGLKARENYEHPAATILLTAHKDLEQLVLTRNELRFKETVDSRWSELVYQGLVVDPLFDDLNAFIDKTQERVTGSVKIKLFKGSATVVARESAYAIYSQEFVSFDDKALDQKDAEGFVKFHGFQARMYNKLLKKD
ncbi:MAG: argininosuccinate synthase [Halobacteriota archaeon]|nr:argininosuccinate synthase [Halobacteriota archaeon]